MEQNENEIKIENKNGNGTEIKIKTENENGNGNGNGTETEKKPGNEPQKAEKQAAPAAGVGKDRCLAPDSAMVAVPPEQLPNVFDEIGRKWMLICTNDPNPDTKAAAHANAMKASWGGMGVLWNKPVCAVFIRPQRYSFGLAEQGERFSLNFFDSEAFRESLRYFGRASGRDEDKMTVAGLTVGRSEKQTPYVAEADTVLLCRKLYADDLKEDGFFDRTLLSNYPTKDFHRMYIGEIESVYRRADSACCKAALAADSEGKKAGKR